MSKLDSHRGDVGLGSPDVGPRSDRQRTHFGPKSHRCRVLIAQSRDFFGPTSGCCRLPSRKRVGPTSELSRIDLGNKRRRRSVHLSATIICGNCFRRLRIQLLRTRCGMYFSATVSIPRLPSGLVPMKCSLGTRLSTWLTWEREHAAGLR